MPTYSYACKDCDNRFDIQQAFSDDALTECPRCHGSLRKLFSSVGVVFKGSGFYRTDSRSAAGSNGSGPAGKEGKDGKGGKVSEGAAAGSNGSSSGESSGSAGGKESGARESGAKETAAKNARPESPVASGSGAKGGDAGRRASSTGSGKVARGA